MSDAFYEDALKQMEQVEKELDAEATKKVDETRAEDEYDAQMEQILKLVKEWAGPDVDIDIARDILHDLVVSGQGSEIMKLQELYAKVREEIDLSKEEERETPKESKTKEGKIPSDSDSEQTKIDKLTEEEGNRFPIMFEDLDGKVQEDLLKFAGVESPAEIDWDENPLAYVPRPTVPSKD